MSALDYYSEWKVSTKLVAGEWRYDVYRIKYDRRGKRYEYSIFWDEYDTLKEAQAVADDLNARR